MKIALVWNATAKLAQITVRYDLYAQGFEALGHDVTTVCPEAAAEGYACKVLTVHDSVALANSAFWKEQGFDVAVLITWHMMPEVLAAIRSAGTSTVAIADSDGQVSFRSHPRATWERMVASHQSVWWKARVTKFWLLLYLFHAYDEDRGTLESTRHSDKLVFGTERAATLFQRLLRAKKRHDLCDRICAAPYPIGDQYCDVPVQADRADRVVGVGRWDSPQKDAALLVKALQLYLESGARTEFVLFGQGGEAIFGSLTRQFPQVRYLGVQPANVIAEQLATSRSLVLSSRWESGPIVAWEALAMGCTIIGTPIPNLQDMISNGQFGQVSASRSAADFAQAIRNEARAWDEGRRSPMQIAEIWRSRAHPVAVCRKLLEALPKQVPTLVGNGTN